jgi:predicted Zn-dependent protease
VYADRGCNGIGGAGVQVGGGLLFAKFSRGDDEADGAGVDELVAPASTRRACPRCSAIAERQARPTAVDQWFTDHPLEEDRVQNTQAQISQINPAIIRTLSNDSRAFQDFKARVRALPAPVAQRARGR